MRAIVLDADRNPILDTAPDPAQPPAGHVRVRVQAAALNPADIKVIAGGFDGKMLHASTQPLMPGFDFAGVVEAVADGVTSPAVGERVFGHLPYSRSNRQGSLADLLTVPADAIGAVPDGVELAEAAATATTGSTALQALRDKGGLQPGGRVLINGASGGVGCHAVQVARLLGAEVVVGTCSAAKMDFVRDLGAEPVDYRQTALAAVEGGPFDVILDAAATSSYRACRNLLTPTGAYVRTLPGPGLILDLIVALFSGKRAAFIFVQSRRADLELLAGWMATGRLRTPLDMTIDRADVAEGLARLASGAVVGKIAVQVG